jgi:hypothetical protein
MKVLTANEANSGFGRLASLARAEQGDSVQTLAFRGRRDGTRRIRAAEGIGRAGDCAGGKAGVTMLGLSSLSFPSASTRWRLSASSSLPAARISVGP